MLLIKIYSVHYTLFQDSGKIPLVLQPLNPISTYSEKIVNLPSATLLIHFPAEQKSYLLTPRVKSLSSFAVGTRKEINFQG